MPRFTSLSLVLVLIIFLNGNLFAQQFLSSQYITTKDGLTNNKITCLYQDIKGYLWIGTEEGLTRYNGVQYEKFFADINQPVHSLSSNNIKHVLQVNDSILLISTLSGANVFNLNTDQFENSLIEIPYLKAGSGEDITTICLIKNREILFATSDSIIITNNKFRTERTLSTKTKSGEWYYFSFPVIYINNDSTEILFNRGKYGGSGIFDVKKNLLYSSAEKFPFLSPFTGTPFGPIQKSYDNSFFYSAYSFGFYVYSIAENRTRQFEISAKGGEYNSVNAILKDAASPSVYWLATGSGLFLFNASKDELNYFDVTQLQTGQTTGRGNCLLFDKQKTLWFGTSDGLYKITKNALEFEKIFELVSKEMIESGLNNCLVDSQNRIWLGSFGSGIFEIINVNNTTIVNQHFECGSLITKIKQLKNKIYVSSGNGVLILNDQSKKFETLPFYPDSLKKTIVPDFHVDETGIYRIGLGNGIGMMELNSASGAIKYLNHYNFPETSPSYLPIRQPSFIAEDKVKKLWFSYNYGDKLMYFDRKKNKYEIIPLIINGISYNNFSASAMFVDSKNKLWLGTTNLGLIVYEIDSRKSNVITRLQGLPGEVCNEIIEDCFGNIWIGTNSGLAKYETETGKIFSITSKEGLPVEQVIWIHYSIIDKDTAILIGDYKSAFRFNPEQIIFYSEAPSLFITRVFSNNNPVNISQNKFSCNQSNFGFEFIGVNLINGDRNQYSYRLIPLDADWINSGTTRMANYHNLSPGNYVFKVKGANAAGIRSEEISYAFSITPAFYQTWWFKLLIALGFASVVYYIYRIRIKRITEIEKMRSRISRDLHDDIGSTLSSINILSNAALSSAGRKTDLEVGNVLQKINVNSQNMLDNMDDIIWSINPSNDRGNKLLTRMREYATQILDASNIEIEFDFDEKVDSVLLDMEQKRGIYLVFKEAVNNLAKYSKSKNAHLNINLRKGFIVMSIKDSGVGFDYNIVSSGNGITNMKKRSADVSGELKIESRKNSGTSITLVIPV